MACRDGWAMDLKRILASHPLAPQMDPHATLGEDGPRTTRFRLTTRPRTTRHRHSLSPFINYCSRGGFSQKEHYGDGPRTRSLGCKQALRPPKSQTHPVHGPVITGPTHQTRQMETASTG